MSDPTEPRDPDEDAPDPLASTQFFDTTSEFGADEAEPTPTPDPTTVQEPDPTAIEEPPAAPVPPPPPPPVPAGAPPAPPADRPSRLPLILASVAAVLLVIVGVLAFLLITGDDDDDDEAAEAPAVTTTTAAPDEDQDEGDEAQDEDAAAAEAEATEALENFIDARGTDAEREFSSEDGRNELDAIVDETGDLDLQGDPECTAQDDDTVECVQPTDQGDLVFTMGIDDDEPRGLEMIGATLE